MSREIALNYFNFWSAKDLKNLEKILHENCVLEDWLVTVNGKDEILELNNAFFEENEISLTINELLVDDDKAFAYLTIVLNNKETLEVVDSLKFLDGQIVKIKAFKG
tara:strand:+ start:99 stop:419 length:321 start_codon:yes stop_codon:yes gene_type:complete